MPNHCIRLWSRDSEYLARHRAHIITMLANDFNLSKNTQMTSIIVLIFTLLLTFWTTTANPIVTRTSSYLLRLHRVSNIG